MGEIIQFRSRELHGPGDDEVVLLHPVRGDSMEPLARDGEVWIYRAQNRFNGPGVYAIAGKLSYPAYCEFPFRN